MAKKKAFGIPQNLSDGIGQTISTANSNVGQLRYEIISLDRIELDPNNPRKLMLERADIIHGISKDDRQYETKQEEFEKLSTLANSIKKVGVRHPIELYKEGSKFILISGERRVLASHLAGKSDIQAKVLDSKPEGIELRLLQWIENIEREDLTVWEKVGNIEQIAEAYKNINHVGLNSESLSELLGCSKKQASRYLSLLNSPSELRNRLKNSNLTDLIKISQIVSTEDPQVRELMISAAETGISREELTQLKKMNTKQKAVKEKPKKGRPETLYKVATNDKEVVKELVRCVVSQDEYADLADKFQSINWNSVGAVKTAFKMLVDMMSKEKVSV